MSNNLPSIEQLKAMKDNLPEDQQDDFSKLVLSSMSYRPINILRQWISNYEEGNPLDTLLATLMGKFFDSTTTKIREIVKDLEDGQEFDGHEAIKIAIITLREIASDIEGMVKKVG